ncbi:MAG: hypothetical protein GX117_09065 [Candidatus Hydrogenedentes bacterium]|jgi:alpha-L-rhamnosidase|nr:hypothetical protein [Candidatus Hydrogenedentota bacterium]
MRRQLIILAFVLSCFTVHAFGESIFSEARPVWLEGRETEMNVFAGFRAIFNASPEDDAQLRITASTLYRVFLNGHFVGHGPARAPHGYYRVDVWDLAPWLQAGDNIVAVEVAGYNSNSYYVLDQPSFLQAEVQSGTKVLCATGREENPFIGFPIPERLQKVQRYSFQRPFVEIYRLAQDYDAWRSNGALSLPKAAVTQVEAKQILSRGVPYPNFEIQPVLQQISAGTFRQNELNRCFEDRSLVNISEKLKGFAPDQLEFTLSDLLCSVENTSIQEVRKAVEADSSFPMEAGNFQVLDLGVNLSGFLRMKVDCDTATRLLISFDETESDLDVNWRRLGCVNAFLVDLEPGQYSLEAFEPHTMRCIKIMTLSGQGVISECGLRRYEHPNADRALFHCSEEKLNRIFEAGRTTFAQNAVDIFMDCPHRERAGWLCDSYFTARAALSLTGKVDVEQNFIQNYLLPESFAHLPEGMLPMCYPADHYDGVFIPNWAMWFVMELGEYAQRGDEGNLIEALRTKIEKLFTYFEGFENETGLLEKLDSWVFVEWSAANNFVQDINYPSNMLYAGALDVAAKLYDRPAWKEKADRIRNTIREQALKAPFFVDNALRKDGTVVLTENITEVCQYFAFYFGVATPEQDPELWRILLDEFGPKRQEQGLYPEVHPANAFIGNILRFELLSRAGRTQQTLHEMVDYLMYMVERTGTLWENQQDHASLNHGFASHAVVTLFRDVLGAAAVDANKKTLAIKLNPSDLTWCTGSIPIGDDMIQIQWQKKDDTLSLYVDCPEDFSVSIDNATAFTLKCSDTPLSLD